jgi:hypothetical protein
MQTYAAMQRYCMFLNVVLECELTEYPIPMLYSSNSTQLASESWLDHAGSTSECT